MMTDDAKLSSGALFEAGRVRDAIAQLSLELRMKPGDSARRYLLAELLCFVGDWERADKQLDLLSHQEPDKFPGVPLFRELLRAAKARQQFFSVGRLPEFIAPPSALTQVYLQASIRLREGQEAEAAELLAQAETLRSPLPATCNGQVCDDFRDLDDAMAGVLEAFSVTGQYYWIPLETISVIQMHVPERPRDLLWRPARLVLAQGGELPMFCPAIYSGSETGSDDICLGHSTDWLGNGLVRGTGLRMFLAGEESIAMLEILELQLRSTEWASA